MHIIIRIYTNTKVQEYKGLGEISHNSHNCRSLVKTAKKGDLLYADLLILFHRCCQHISRLLQMIAHCPLQNMLPHFDFIDPFFQTVI